MSSLLRCQITILWLSCDLKTRASTRANTHVDTHTHAHTQTHEHKEYCLDDKLFRLSQACFQSSTPWNCKRTTRTFIRLRLLRSIDGCVLASPNDSATSATTSHMCTTAYASVPPSHERKCPYLSRLNWRWHRPYAGRRSSHQSGRRHNTHAHAFPPLQTRTKDLIAEGLCMISAPVRAIAAVPPGWSRLLCTSAEP